MRYHAGNHIVSFGKKLSVLLPMLVLTVSVFGQSVNLVKNGNFSEGTKEWSPGTTGQIDSKVYKQTKDATDTNSLKVTSTVLWVEGGQAIKVEPNVEYRISAWVKMENASQTHVKLYWGDADGKLISTDYLFAGTDGTSDWQEKTGVFKSPANASSMSFTFMSGGKPETPGTLWIDSVVVKKNASPSTSNADWGKAVSNLYGNSGIATPMAEKVIYYDIRHDIAGVSGIEPLVHFFKARGFTVKNADELKSWMEKKITDGADATICILAMGIIPDSICENRNSPTLKKYMEAGGRLVWIGDVPLFYLSHIQRGITNCGWGADVLGYRDGSWNISTPGIITDSGKKWGIERSDDTAMRAVRKDSVTVVFSELTAAGLACSYFINYNALFPYSGFIRFYGAGAYAGGVDIFNRDLFRIALYRGAPVAIPDAPDWKAVEEAEKPIAVNTMLENYNRGDKIKVKVKSKDISQINKINLTLLDGSKAIESFNLPVKASQEMTLETADLAPGHEYVLSAETIYQNGKTAVSERRIYLAPVKTVKLPVGMYTVSEGTTRAKTNIILKDLADHLGEGGLISLYPSEGYSYIADQILRYGLKIVGCSSCYYSAALPVKNSPELLMRLSNGELPLKYHYSIVGDGKAPVCMGNPVNRENINELLKKDISCFTGYPGFSNRSFLSDDCGMFGDPGTNLLVCYCNYCKGKFKELTGNDAPLTATAEIMQGKGVINDNDTWYSWMRFRSGTVYGEWNRSMRQAAQAVSAGIKIAPLPAGMGGSPVLNPPWALNSPDNYASTGISSYYYYPVLRVPPTCHLIYSEMAMMGNRNNELWPMPQSSDWDHAIVDPELHVALVKGQYFNLLAAGASAIVYFNYPLMPGTKAWEEFKNFAPLGVKFGPLLRNSPKEPRQVAVLASFCDASYRWCKSGGSNANYETIYMELRKNNIQADFVSDEEIAAGILKNYRVIVVGNDNYMLRSVQGKIQEFVNGGGTVLIDNNSKIAIQGAKATQVSQIPASVSGIAPQHITINTQSIIASEFDAGEAKLFILANCTIDKQAAGNVTVPGNVLYNLRKGIKISSGDLITLAPGDGTLIFAVPSAPSAINAQVSADGIAVAIVGGDGKIINASFPIKFTVFAPDGKEVAEYSDFYVTTKGRLVIKPFLARNDPAGEWTSEILELASGVKTKVQFTK